MHNMLEDFFRLPYVHKYVHNIGVCICKQVPIIYPNFLEYTKNRTINGQANNNELQKPEPNSIDNKKKAIEKKKTQNERDEEKKLETFKYQ